MNPDHRQMIEQLYLETYDMLMTYARCSFPEESLAEEAVQEAFQIACRKPESLCESANPKGWLVKTLRYTICNMKRSREHARQILSRYLTVQNEQVVSLDDQLSLQTMYGNASQTEEFILIKEMVIDCKSHLEMATARGITVNACKKRVQRAKNFLIRKIAKDVTP